MKVVKPVTVGETELTASTIAEPDATVGEVEWSAGTYNLGDRVIKSSTHRVYEVVADPSTTDDPEVGVDTDPATWIDVGPTNRFAMFDTVNSTKSSDTTQLEVEITPGQIINSLAVFGMEQVTDAVVEMVDPIDGAVYYEELDLSDNSQVTDWYYYFFAPIIRASDFILLDLPAYPSAVLTITFNGNNIKVGTVVIGNQLPLGVANYGTSVQLLDFSKKETDSFGNTVVRPGRTSKLVSYDITVERTRVSYVFNTLATLTSTPCVYVGSETGEDDGSLVFGYYRDFQNNISSPTLTDATLTIEGLV